jgi:hypothetical protein
VLRLPVLGGLDPARPSPIDAHSGGLLMAAGSRHSGLTTTETRLVEQYVSVLDYVSRCAQAIDHGDWFYLHDKAGALAFKAERLAAIAREASDAPRRPRKQAVQAAVAWFGRHYRAARLLHPLDPQGGERR